MKANAATLVAPDDNNLDLTWEQKALRQLFGKPPEILRRFTEVHQRLTTGEPIGLLHFACHGFAETQHLLGSKLILQDNDPLRPVDLPPPVSGSCPPVNGSLVFLNTCQSGLPGWRLTGHGSWANTFLSQGAGAVIATSWAIKNDVAARIASTFSAHLGEGLSIAQALFESRRQIRVEGDPSRLAYTLYSTPAAHLQVERGESDSLLEPSISTQVGSNSNSKL